MPRTPEKYAAYLSKKRDALTHFKQPTEIPQSLDLPNTAHRKLVIAAFLDANGDPADGGWTQLVHLCRLATTRGGYRWLGTRVESRGGRGQSITRVDSKYLDESCLIQKVESWKQTIEMANGFAEGSNFHKSQARQTPLDFKVAKRTNSFLPPSFPSHLVASTPQPGRRKPPPIPHVSFSSPLIFSGNVQVRDGTPATKARVRRSFSGHGLLPSTVARPTSSPGIIIQHNVPPQSYTDNVENNVFGSFAGERVLEAEGLNKPKSQVHLFNLLDANGDDFHPPFTSTQKGVGAEGTAPSRTDYNSHFDVDRRVEDVVKLLEEDVGLYR